MCYISIVNMSNNNNSDSDDDMAFSNGPTRGDSISSGGGGGSFKKIAVKRDNETGEITGWQDFYNMARLENPSL